jgi:hypothetical protein
VYVDEVTSQTALVIQASSLTGFYISPEAQPVVEQAFVAQS